MDAPREAAAAPRIVPASGDDLPEVLDLLSRAGLPPAGIDAHFPGGFVVARGADGALAGVAGLEMYESAALLRSVAVAEDERGTGLGERLARAAEALAEGRGVREMYLLTTSAEGYFPRLGYVRIAREDLPEALAASEQLRGACPATAIAMHRPLG